MEQFFNPKKICLVGVSHNTHSFSYQIAENVNRYRNQKQLDFVNANTTPILGKKVFKSVYELSNNYDLALIFLPAKYVLETIEELAKKECKHFVIYSSGFKELGKKGCDLENQLRDLIRKYNIYVIGPNCMGIIDTHSQLYASNWFYELRPGNVALISQSGAYGMIISYMAKKRNMAFSKFINVGNMAGINYSDILNYLEHDDTTDIVLIYMESLQHDQYFFREIKKIIQSKLVILLKANRTQEGSFASNSHTGGILEDQKLFKMVCERVGIVYVEDVEDMVNIAYCYNYNKKWGDKVCIVSPSGGPCVIAADIISDWGLQLPHFGKDTIVNLKKCLPEIVNIRNPLDITTLTSEEAGIEALEVLCVDENIDWYILMVFTNIVSENLEKCIEILKRKDRSFLVITLEEQKLYDRFSELECPVFFSINQAIRSVGILQRSMSVKRETVPIYLSLNSNTVSRKCILNEYESKVFLATQGISLPQGHIISESDDVEKYNKLISEGVSAKIVSDLYVHKSSVGGVRLNINSVKKLKELVIQWKEEFGENTKILIEPMIKEGLEFFVSIFYDNVAGICMCIGIGGIYTDYFKDKYLDLASVEKKEIMRNFRYTSMYDLLQRVADDNEDIFFDFIAKLVNIFLNNPELRLIEINPIKVNKTGIYVLDALIEKIGGNKEEYEIV